ncbi:MAG: molecular chaperone DnaJ [Alphaproteobacteria bacterium]
MAKRDYYDVLGVAKNADDKALKSAFRKQAMKYHPDRNPDDASAEAKFKEVNEAYGILSDAQKRAAYDRMGHAAFEGGGGGGGSPFGQGGFEGFGDIFEEMFGGFSGARGARGRQRQAQGADSSFKLGLTMEEAHKGLKKSLKIPTAEACDTCSGSGATPGSQPTTCKTCGGRGSIRRQQGFFAVEQTCPSCHGEGSVISNPCRACNGQGLKKTTKTIEVDIPAGIEENMRIRVAGKGEAGRRGAPSGDLYIFPEIKRHKIFERDGSDLHVSATIPVAKAALGGNLEVPSIDGKRHRVSIPEGTNSGATFRLRGLGMNIYGRQSRGDMYVDVQVETPTNLTERQREILEEFQVEGENASPKAKGFFDRVSEFFKT